MEQLKNIENSNHSQRSEIDERLMELASLFEISKTLSSSLNLQSVLNNMLLTPMGRLMISKGVVLLEKQDFEFTIEAIKGLPRELLEKKIHIDNVPDQPFFTSEIIEHGYNWIEFFVEFDIQIIFPINSSNKTIGILAFGSKLSGNDFSSKEIDFLSSISNLSATAIQNSLMFGKIQEVNLKLDHSNQELNTLFDIGSELNSTLNKNKIVKVLGFALMGQLLINKYAVFLKTNDNFILAGSKGIEKLNGNTEEMISGFFSGLNEPFQTEKGGDEFVTSWLKERQIALIIPMKIQDVTRGIICLGEKINKVGYSKENMEFLVTLGNQAMISLENARLFEEALEKQRMEEELAVAHDIQSQLLPDKIPHFAEMEIQAINIPSKAVGGDYFDIIELDENIVGIVIADVSGKGVPASLLMANLQASFRALADVINDPAQLAENINNIIYKNTTADKFITYFYCMINRKTRELEYCNAGHNPPVVISDDATVLKLDKGGLILGMLPDMEYEKGKIRLNKGDVIVMYTDGITEALNSASEEFEEHRLLEICQAHHHASARELRDEIINAVKDFCGKNPQSDDITLVNVKII